MSVGTSPSQWAVGDGLRGVTAALAVAGDSAAPAHEDALLETVLPPAGRDMATLIGLVALIAMGEAGWNVAQFCEELLQLPTPLAVAFPVLAEATALSFALQDLRDRRRGVASRGLRAATHLTLTASSVINGAVGFTAYGVAGLLEMLPPLVLAAVVHLHGERATRAWHSRAITRPQWRREQLHRARVASVSDVLELLTGDDPDGRAAAGLLRLRLADNTLSPAQALEAAGWHERLGRTLSPTQLQRLEIVAATVWDASPSPPTSRRSTGPSATGSGRKPSATSLDRRRTPSTEASATETSSTPSTRRPSSPSVGDLAAESAGPKRATDQELVSMVLQARRSRSDAGEGLVRVLVRQAGVTASAARIRRAVRVVDGPTFAIATSLEGELA